MKSPRRKAPAFDLAAFNERQAIDRAARQAEADRLKAIETEIRATQPDRTAAVQKSCPRSGSRHTSLERIEGPREAVFAYASYVLNTATCTQCYEHMLPRMIEAQETERGYMVLLSTNLYAGD